MEKLDDESAAKFITALTKSVQTLCHGFLNFHNGIEIVGYINLNVDKGSNLHYVLEEKVCKNEENSTLFISNSFRAQSQKNDSKTSENVPSGSETLQRSNSTDMGSTGKLSSAISSISSALSRTIERSRTGSTASARETDSHSKPVSNTAKRKASDDYSEVRSAKSSHVSSSPSPVGHFLPHSSPHGLPGQTSPVDSKAALRDLRGEDLSGMVLPQTAGISGDGGDLGVNLAGSVLERVDDHSNSDLADRGDDSDNDLEVTFIKEEYVEGEQSSCQFENSSGQQQQYGRGTHQRASSSDNLPDTSMYGLHPSASATYVPSAQDLAAQHYGPSTSSQLQPGTPGVRGEPMGQLSRKKQDDNIERQNKWAMSHLRDWLAQEQLPTDFESNPAEEIDDLLSRYFQNARKKNGAPFSASALLALRTSLTRHLKGPPFLRSITLATDPRFKRSQSAFEHQMALAGSAQPVTKAERITPQDFAKLYQSGVLNNDNPTSLLHKVWFELQWHLGRPGGRRSWGSVPADSFVFDSDERGEFVYMRCFEQGAGYTESSPRKMYADPGGPNCPVRTLQLYLEKRNPRCDAFLQVPERAFIKLASSWYQAEGLKEYKLGCLMKTISNKAQLSKIYTNLSV